MSQQQQQLSPEQAYLEALGIWTHGWDDAFAAGLSKEEKHKVRRDKLVEFLKAQDIPELVKTIESRIVECEGRAMTYPNKKQFYKREASAAQGILTVIQRSILLTVGEKV